MKKDNETNDRSKEDPVFAFFNPDKSNPSDQIKADIIIIIVSIPFVYYMCITAVQGFVNDPTPMRAVFAAPMLIAAFLGAKGAVQRAGEIIALSNHKKH